VAGLVADLGRHERIGLDTAVFIYHIEGATPFAGPAGNVLGDLAGGAFAGVTSVLTLMELTVRPLQLGRPEVADEYEVLVAHYPNLTIAEIDRPTARRAAELRAVHRLRPADALQVAACLEQGATAFVTNDRDLRRVSEITVLLLSEYLAS
jgi:predicted nucleic acid-binding protein